jgi:histidine triad (HIT) family protein
MAKTLFEKIIDREIPARIEHEDESCIVIHDVQPRAPIHVLIIPKKPIARIGEATAADQAVLGHLLLTAGAMAKKLGLVDGFRLVINHGPHGGESVPHLHVHLLAGRPLAWPPG